jgi:hypothetical protein
MLTLDYGVHKNPFAGIAIEDEINFDICSAYFYEISVLYCRRTNGSRKRSDDLGSMDIALKLPLVYLAQSYDNGVPNIFESL